MRPLVLVVTEPLLSSLEDLEGFAFWTLSPLVRPELPEVPEDLVTEVPPLRELELEDPLLAVLPLLRVLLLLFPVTSEPRERPLVLLELLEELMVPPWALVVLWLPLFT